MYIFKYTYKYIHKYCRSLWPMNFSWECHHNLIRFLRIILRYITQNLSKCLIAWVFLAHCKFVFQVGTLVQWEGQLLMWLFAFFRIMTELTSKWSNFNIGAQTDHIDGLDHTNCIRAPTDHTNTEIRVVIIPLSHKLELFATVLLYATIVRRSKVLRSNRCRAQIPVLLTLIIF